MGTGQYVYDGNADGDAGTFSYSEAVVNFNTETEVGTEYNITEGTLINSRNGNEYEISFNCKTDGGKSLTGYYKGTIPFYNYTKGLKFAVYKNRLW